ncbi:MAG: MFS transporter [Candidatus Lokiarchaeota archaeon]|nr:MFS transporter [Candidatus Lokiarchaeota archaeon]
MAVNIIVQMLWVSFTTVTSLSAVYYGVGEFEIILLAMTFMIAYIPVTFLSAWVLDKYDFKIGAGLGATLIGIFGLLRFFAFNTYILVLIFQLGIAVGQPFILNAYTKLSANWFPESERQTATGLSMLSQFLGIALGMFVTPYIVINLGELGFPVMNLLYGSIALIFMLLFLVFAKSRPPTPPSKELISEKVMMTEGLKQLFTNKKFLILFVSFFFGVGVLNWLITFSEGISLGKGYDQLFAGNFGGFLVFGGIVGSLVVSFLAEKIKSRKILLMSSFIIATISLFIISFSTEQILILIFSFLLGFGILSAAPVALEYAVDITKPVPEASSNGMLMMFGQVGGIILMLGLEGVTLPNGDYFPSLILQAIFLAIIVILTLFLKEPE